MRLSEAMRLGWCEGCYASTSVTPELEEADEDWNASAVKAEYDRE